jgi:ABC-type branched-subunit amino acid transport system substrate-binding protein
MARKFFVLIFLGFSVIAFTSCNPPLAPTKYAIGLSLCLTGSLSNYGLHFQEVADMLLEHINSAGGFSDGAKLSR